VYFSKAVVLSAFGCDPEFLNSPVEFDAIFKRVVNPSFLNPNRGDFYGESSPYRAGPCGEF
jgi:hypothetical protein